MEFFFQFARLKLVLLKSHIRREFIYIKKFLCLGQAIKSLGDSCLHHSKFVEQDATRPCFYLVWTKFSRVIWNWISRDNLQGTLPVQILVYVRSHSSSHLVSSWQDIRSQALDNVTNLYKVDSWCSVPWDRS